MRDRDSESLVSTSRQLDAGGVSAAARRSELTAGRWRRAGHAVVLHNGPLSPAQRRQVARVHAGPRAVFTAFTAAELAGLRGWEREEVHLLAPAGTRLRHGCPVPVRLHLHGPTRVRREPGRAIEHRGAAVIRAAGTFEDARSACGLLAAVVQQRVCTAPALVAELAAFPRVRHRRLLALALADIAGGADSLAEIDFVRLCRRHGLPPPHQQRRRREPDGRVRYLDASWRRADGREVVVEVDGAVHLQVRRWWADQLRQNEITLGAATVLRFPAVVVRTDERLVADQLRRALLL